jgi:SAM-dependent methyltransferase
VIPSPHPDHFASWLGDLERRHLADLTFSEVSRALRALSSAYVERRSTIGEGGALSGAGKRAAFALFYGPLHFLLVRHIVGELALGRNHSTLVDVGCGTGVAGAAWASLQVAAPEVIGIDKHPWAADEARRTYRAFGLRARVRTGDAAKIVLPRASAVVAAFALNEIDDISRGRLLTDLLAHATRGGQLLIVEPLAGFVAPWWASWRREVEARGGRADEWRARIDLPPLVEKLDRAAGLNHREIKGRSLVIGT